MPAITFHTAEITIEDLLFDLKRKIYITKSARFAASRRLARMSGVSTVAVNFLAISSILISVVSIVFSKDMTDILIKIVAVASIVVAVYSIVLDMYLRMKNYEKRSFILLQSARRISDLSGDLDLLLASKKFDEGSVRAIGDRYKQILSDFEEQHADIDFRYATIAIHQNEWWHVKVYHRLFFLAYPLYAFLCFMLVPCLVLLFSGFAFFRMKG